MGAFYCSQLINTSLLIKTTIRGNINIHHSKKKENEREKSLLVFMSLVASLSILAACSNTTKEQKPESKALPTINERIQKETKEVMEQSKLIKDTDITVDQKKKSFL